MRLATKKRTQPIPTAVAQVLQGYPAPIRKRLTEIRSLIFATAAEIEGVGPLTETLKWGEPAYLTEVSKSGSTIRLGRVPRQPLQCAIYFNCKTTLLDSFRVQLGDVLTLAGDRAIVLEPDTPLPEHPLRICLAMALTYHRSKLLPRQKQSPAK